jgi:inner membrane protein
MASLGHVAVGMLVGRVYRPESVQKAILPMLFFSGLALLPDLDLIGVGLGLPNVGACGHRGASHSLVVPLGVLLIVALAAPRMKLPRWRTAALSSLAVASHLLLDAMTVGSRGIPLFWPVDFQRFPAPWRPIPDAPCGLAFISMTGLKVACTELVQFFPLVLFALVPWRLAKPAVSPPLGNRPNHRPPAPESGLDRAA